MKRELGESLARFLLRSVGEIPAGLIINGRLANEKVYNDVALWARLRLEGHEEEKTTNKSARELAAEAGYNLFGEFKSAEEYQWIRKYYAEGEELCKFGDSERVKFNRIFWLVRKDIDEIRRENFRGKEKRDDIYGTSCMSIEVSRANGFIRICNRYNHTVAGCDNTLDSNLERVAEGLTAAFERDFNLKIQRSARVSVSGAVEVSGKLFFYEKEIGGYYISPKFQNFVTPGGEIVNCENNYILIDVLLIDINNPQESVNLAARGTKFLAGLPKNTPVKVHDSLEIAERAHEKEPDVLHIVRGGGK